MQPARPTPPDAPPEIVQARRWFALAVGVLLLAGLLALVLVAGRLPGLDGWLGTRIDPLFFRRCLVVHVDLALVIWFQAFIAGMCFLLPGRGASSNASRAGAPLAALGVALFVAAAGLPGVQPILSNYVPVLDHPLFFAGQVIFGLGVLLAVLDPRRWRERSPGVVPLPDAARTGLRAASIALALAALTFGISAATVPAGLHGRARYELMLWGGGHVLQLGGETAMAAVWIVLCAQVLGRSPLGARAGRVVFGALLAPWLAAPFLALAGPATATGRIGFTVLMRWAIFPPVALVMAACGRELARALRAGRLGFSPALAGLAASAGLTLAGWALGFSIRGTNTIVPAHYHAAIGAVTAAFMTVAVTLLEPLGLALPAGRVARAARLQPLVYGAGQFVFALGFALAGLHGAPRKTYGAEQHVRGLAEAAGLAVMGAGGLVAVAGGLLFLWIAIAAGLLPRPSLWRNRWTTKESIPSRS